MSIGYIFSQKCNENAKMKRLIDFELWKYFFVYILKKGQEKTEKNGNFCIAK